MWNPCPIDSIRKKDPVRHQFTDTRWDGHECLLCDENWEATWVVTADIPQIRSANSFWEGLPFFEGQQQSYVYPKPNLHQCQVLLVSIDRVIRVGADNVSSDRRTHSAFQMGSTMADPLTIEAESFIVANILWILDLCQSGREMGSLGFEQKYKKHNFFQPVSLWYFRVPIYNPNKKTFF